MKIVAKCLAFVSFPYQVHVKVCKLIPLRSQVKNQLFSLFPIEKPMLQNVTLS